LESSFNQSPALYNLFFNRIDFILGLTKELKFCEDAEKYPEYSYGQNNLEPLCMNGNDKTPPNAKQPPEVINYYEKLERYREQVRAARANQHAINPGSPPVKPWTD
jgi:hypothetical protein